MYEIPLVSRHIFSVVWRYPLGHIANDDSSFDFQMSTSWFW